MVVMAIWLSSLRDQPRLWRLPMQPGGHTLALDRTDEGESAAGVPRIVARTRCQETGGGHTAAQRWQERQRGLLATKRLH